MTNKEILKKAIEKAFPLGATGRVGALIMTLDKFPQDIFQEYSLEKAIIFNHDFAKAFWGEKMVHKICGGEIKQINYNVLGEEDEKSNLYCVVCDTSFDDQVERGFSGGDLTPSWKIKLQQMILEEDPIKYLERFI